MKLEKRLIPRIVTAAAISALVLMNKSRAEKVFQEASQPCDRDQVAQIEKIKKEVNASRAQIQRWFKIAYRGENGDQYIKTTLDAFSTPDAVQVFCSKKDGGELAGADETASGLDVSSVHGKPSISLMPRLFVPGSRTESQNECRILETVVHEFMHATTGVLHDKGLNAEDDKEEFVRHMLEDPAYMAGLAANLVCLHRSHGGADDPSKDDEHIDAAYEELKKTLGENVKNP